MERLGAGSDFCPFFDHAGIPSIDTGFVGDYGVYHSIYDDFYWMKKFGDPTFEYHAGARENPGHARTAAGRGGHVAI